MTEHAGVFKKVRSAEADRGNLDRHLLPAFGELRLDRIDQAAVTRFALSMKSKSVTANRCLALLSHVYTKAGAWGVLPPATNPAKGVPRYREQTRERFLSTQELGRLGAALTALENEGKRTPEHAVSPFALAALRLLLLTGMRPGGAIALRWEHVDLDRSVLRLPDSKTGQKTVRLNPPAVQVLSRLSRVDGEARVFPPRHSAAEELDLESAWYRVRDRAQLEGVRMYDAVRHTFASIGVMSGASLYLVGKALGHAKATTTQRYAHVAAGPLEALSADVGGRIADALEGRVAEPDALRSAGARR